MERVQRRREDGEDKIAEKEDSFVFSFFFSFFFLAGMLFFFVNRLYWLPGKCLRKGDDVAQ
jgi:hypothetical protein